jgi:hypothetical protein
MTDVEIVADFCRQIQAFDAAIDPALDALARLHGIPDGTPDEVIEVTVDSTRLQFDAFQGALENATNGEFERVVAEAGELLATALA